MKERELNVLYPHPFVTTKTWGTIRVILMFHIDFFQISIFSFILMISNNNKVSYVTLIINQQNKSLSCSIWLLQ